MTLDIGGIDGSLTGRIPHRFVDLLRIATFVLGADGAIDRGENDDEDDSKWCRHFRITIGVSDPDFWNGSGIAKHLESTLGFLSQDTFRFTFQKRDGGTPHQLAFSGQQGEPVVSWSDINHVSLFSGGLDSFTGAADLLFNHKSKTVLVSHRSSPKVWNYQTNLVRDLSAQARDHDLDAPKLVAVKVFKHLKRLRTEHTQRTRSFLYAAIAGATAELIGVDEIRMYENGVIAINLPIADSVVGTRATRTAHPRVLIGFAKILSLVAGRTISVVNPYALKTRSEVLQVLATTPSIHLAKHTISCAHVHKQSNMHPHCGACSQCIDRQLSFLSAGLAEHDSAEGYAHSLVTDEWTDPSPRALLLNWISTATNYAEIEDADTFLQKYGDAARATPPLMESLGFGSEEAATAIFQLHKRHGEAVCDALNTIHKRTAIASLNGKMAASTLPVLLARQVLERSGQSVTHTQSIGIRNELRQTGDSWTIQFRNSEPVHVADSPGIRYLSILLGDPGTIRTAASLIATDAGLEPEQLSIIDKKGQDDIRQHLLILEQERDRAQEFCDEPSAQRCQAEIDALLPLLRINAPPSTTDAVTAKAVNRHVTEVVASLGKANSQLGSHLDEFLRMGAVFWYRRSGMHWHVAPSTNASSTIVHLTNSTEENSGPQAGRANETSSPGLFRSGNGWLIQFNGKEAAFKDLVGIRLLQQLLASPQIPIAALELEGLQDSVRQTAQPVVDEAAIEALKKDLLQIQHDLAEPSYPLTSEAEEALHVRRDQLSDEVKLALGPNRVRNMKSEQSGSTNRVRAALRRAIMEINRALPELGAHLSESLKNINGANPCYYPTASVVWRVNK